METPTIKTENTAEEKYSVTVLEPVDNSTNSSCLEAAQVTAGQELACGSKESCIEQKVKMTISDTSNTSEVVSNGSLNLTSHALSFVPSRDENSTTHCTTSREIKEEAIETAMLGNEISAREENPSPPAYFNTFVLHWRLVDLQDSGRFVPDASFLSELSVFLRALNHKFEKTEDAHTFCKRSMEEHVSSKEISNSDRLLLEKLFPQEEPETCEVDEIEKVRDNLNALNAPASIIEEIPNTSTMQLANNNITQIDSQDTNSCLDPEAEQTNNEIASVTQTDLKLVIKKKIQEQLASETTEIDSQDAPSYVNLKVEKPDTNGERASVTPESGLRGIVQKISIHELQNMIKNACSSSSKNFNLPNCEESSLPNDSPIMQSKSLLMNIAPPLNEASCANEINLIPSSSLKELGSVMHTSNDSSNYSHEDTGKFNSNIAIKDFSLEEGKSNPELSLKRKNPSKKIHTEMIANRKQGEPCRSAHLQKRKLLKSNGEAESEIYEKDGNKTDVELPHDQPKKGNKKPNSSVIDEVEVGIRFKNRNSALFENMTRDHQQRGSKNLASSLSEDSCANEINHIPSRPSNELGSVLYTINDSSNDSCDDIAKFSSDDSNATMKNHSLEEGELSPELSPKKKHKKMRDRKSSKRSYSEMNSKRKEQESASSNSARFRKTKSHEKRNYRRRRDEPERKKPKKDTSKKKLAYNPSKRENEKSRTSVFLEMRAAVQSLSPTPFTSSSSFCHSRSSHYDVASPSSSNNNSPYRSDDDPYEILQSRLFESIGKTFMSSRKALMVILSWVPMWLKEVDEPGQKELPPLFGNAPITLKPTKHHYSNLLEYFNIVFPLMLLDLFSRLHGAYKNFIKDKKCRPYKFDFIKAKEVDNVIDIDAEMLFPPMNFPTIEGQLAIITLGLNCGNKSDVFGYIRNQYVTTELSSRSEVLHVRIQIVFSMWNNINKDMQMSVMAFYPLEKVLNMIDALNYLETSPLQDIILSPCQPECTKIVLERIGGIAESVRIVNRTIEKIKDGISINKSKKPRILVIDSPPGTDLMSTLIAFIEDVKKYETPHERHRILVCTRTLKHLSNIGLRLLPLGGEDSTCSPINITILLKASGISDPELKKLTLEYQMLEQIRFMKRKKETSQGQWSEDEARKFVINRTDVVLSQIPHSYDSSIQPLFGMGKDLQFSFCILDESYTFTEPEASLPLLYGVRKLVLVGDSQQQPRALSNIIADYDYYQPLPTRLTKKRYSVHF